MSKIWLLLNVTFAIVLGVMGMTNFTTELDSKSELDTETEIPVSNEPLTIDVTLETHYIDGEVEKKHVKETILSMRDFWNTYEDWQVMKQEEGAIRFRREKDDISPFIKAHGYFGIKDETLTIFEGIPVEETAIQSFYQIDTEELETHLYKDLQEGIKIESKKDYLHVLETFRSYQNIEAVKS